ncbi:hypothetical protein [Phormidium sp. CCY1219]|jgi:hypothetical protein|uniref:hypothetical protein n=1 Tax=Phormidium sp. CCY1219 TaxID=2886104 RepID=UPI002D1E8354|nr:hypothetical protein [Phormidium sp. CCY1219]MEB3827142.1 hypothetical protein [Phormidium sp. CCY1219]
MGLSTPNLLPLSLTAALWDVALFSEAIEPTAWQWLSTPLLGQYPDEGTAIAGVQFLVCCPREGG